MLLYIIIYKYNTNKLVIYRINECYQISYKLYNKQHTHFFTRRTPCAARNKNTKIVYF